VYVGDGMARRVKPSPEKFYGSTIGWGGWTFRVLSSLQGVRYLDLHPTPFPVLEEKLHAKIVPDDLANEVVLDQLHAYLDGRRKAFAVPLDLRGTPFQQSVWEAVSEIPYGKTVAYADIALRIGRANALRAVGQAVGANPVPIIVPCHRVVGKGGQLTGFGGGLPLKERLLALERGSLNL